MYIKFTKIEKRKCLNLWNHYTALLISISIELLQGLEVYLKVVEDFSPVMDINDVICNVVGGAIGVLAAMCYKKNNKGI